MKETCTTHHVVITTSAAAESAQNSLVHLLETTIDKQNRRSTLSDKPPVEMPSSNGAERTPLLQNGSSRSTREETVQFNEDGDDDNPREWPLSRKYFQIAQIFAIALICPMTSSISAAASSQISDDLQTSQKMVLGGQTGFVCMLGIGPLFFAPMSETFGRRNLFVINLSIFVSSSSGG